MESMAAGLRQVAALPDPVGEVPEGWTRPNGLRIRRVRVPLGVVAIIYENRPNVTSDAAGLCVKSGNAAFLRGSSGAIDSNIAIAARAARGLCQGRLTAGLADPGGGHESRVRGGVHAARGFVDCLIPRGGPSLIASILENATVPYVIDGDGNCHVYVDADADLDMAAAIIANAKTQRPSVCNAAETLLVHSAVAERFLPMARDALGGVELVGDVEARRILGHQVVGVATEADWADEFLALKLAVGVVPSLDAAIDHITRYSSGHSEAIVTGDLVAAQRFTQEVDAAAVLVNASTRFVDGGEFGFGAESASAPRSCTLRGPMGLRELTTCKYIIEGAGQVRG